MRMARRLSAPRIRGGLPERIREPKPQPPTVVKIARNAATIAVGSAVAFIAFKAFTKFGAQRAESCPGHTEFDNQSQPTATDSRRTFYRNVYR
jgi:hypothetical protein